MKNHAECCDLETAKKIKKAKQCEKCKIKYTATIKKCPACGGQK